MRDARLTDSRINGGTVKAEVVRCGHRGADMKNLDVGLNDLTDRLDMKIGRNADVTGTAPKGFPVGVRIRYSAAERLGISILRMAILRGWDESPEKYHAMRLLEYVDEERHRYWKSVRSKANESAASCESILDRE